MREGGGAVSVQRRPRVVFLDHVARMSGGEIALLRLLGALRDRVDAYVILGEDGPLADRLRELGIPVEVLPLDPDVREVRRSVVTPTQLSPRVLFRMLRDTWRLRTRLRVLRPDLVHTNSLKSAFYGGLAGRLARVPVIWHVRDRIADDYLPRSAVLLIRAASRVLPSAVICNSRTTLETLPARLHAHVLYNPIVPDAVERPAAFERRAAHGMTIGVAGRLAPWKGQHVFLDAFAEAFPDGTTRAHVIGSAMFGEDAYAEGLVAQAERLGIADRVDFRGFRDDIWAELAELDLLVHCSTSPEPFGQVVIEGMASGVPVIAAAAGGPTEVIQDEVSGLLVEPNDAVALAKALRRLAEDPGLRARLGAAGQTASREFTPERTAEQLLQLYEQLLGGDVTE
jgi:glycosyltransferase involved in cell wall biosynthesis